MTSKLLLASVVVTYILMVFGGIVTSTGSGLGCPDWPLCHGQLLPFQIKEEFPTPPAPAVVETHLQPWIEQTHRLLGGLAGVLILASLVSVWRNYSGFPKKAMVAVIVLLILEALLGMRVVVTEAPLLKEFLHYVYTTSHLILSVVILSALTLTYTAVSGKIQKDFPLSEALFLIVMFQILIGILVRYVKAPDFNLFAYFLHITIAMGLVIFSLYLMVKSFNGKTLTTFLLVSLQAIAGVGTILSKFFLPILFVHIAVGFLLVIWVSYLVSGQILSYKIEG